MSSCVEYRAARRRDSTPAWPGGASGPSPTASSPTPASSPRSSQRRRLGGGVGARALAVLALPHGQLVVERLHEFEHLGRRDPHPGDDARGQLDMLAAVGLL